VPNPSIFTSVINGYLPEPHASLLNGIIFGIQPRSSAELYEQLRVVGLLHIVVLSGTNIALLSALVSGITSGIGKKASLLITILVVIFFVAFVGPQAPIIRAAIMGILTSVAIIYGRRSFALYSLFLSALVIAVVWPDWLESISFYLSYGATLGLILWAPRTPGNTVAHYLTTEFKTSLAAQALIVPILFVYFKQISLISPLTNVLISFVIGPLMVFGFAAALLGKIHFLLGIVPAYVCYGILQYVLTVVQLLSRVPFASIQF
jgi:competence protein ComEC